MQEQKEYKKQGNEKIRMLALFNTLTEEDKDFVISMSDSLVSKHGIFRKVNMNRTVPKKEILSPRCGDLI